MKKLFIKVNNYWRTLGLEFRGFKARKLIWVLLKWTLLILRLVCFLIDYFDNGPADH